MENNKIQKIKLIIALAVIFVVAIIVIVRIAIYQKVGEKNMPYSISKVIVVSTANKYEKQEDEDLKKSEEQNIENSDGENSSEEQIENSDGENSSEEQEEESQSEENKNDEEQLENQQNEVQPATEDNSIWKFDVIQTSDIYISIEKNEANIKKDEKIKSVSIANIQIENGPQKGKIKAFMPNSLDGEKYDYSEEYIIKDSLTYRGSSESNLQNLQISENGGIIGISVANIELGEYASGEDTEITYDGTLLAKLGITDEELKSKLIFDLIIELDDGKKYSGKVSFEINCDGLVESGKAQLELNDFNDVIFKRI